jgi:hypothetical protein
MYSSYTAGAIDVWEARCAIWGDRHADVARGGGGLTKRSALGGRQIFVGCCCERTSASPTQLRTVNRNVISLWLRRVGRCLLLLISGLVRWPARPEDDGARARLHLGFSSQPQIGKRPPLDLTSPLRSYAATIHALHQKQYLPRDDEIACTMPVVGWIHNSVNTGLLPRAHPRYTLHRSGTVPPHACNRNIRDHTGVQESQCEDRSRHDMPTLVIGIYHRLCGAWRVNRHQKMALFLRIIHTSCHT